MKEYLKQSYFGNTVTEWLLAAGIVLVSVFVIRLFAHIVLKKLRQWALRTDTTWDNFIVEIIRSKVVPALYISSVYFSLKTLVLPACSKSNIAHGLPDRNHVLCPAHH